LRPSVLLSTSVVISLILSLLQTVVGRLDELPKPEAPQATKDDAEMVLFDWSATPNEVVPWLKKNEQLLDRGDGCTLTVHWAAANQRSGQPSSAVHEIASLIVVPGAEETHTTVRDRVSGSGLNIRVGVLYFPVDSNVWGLRIALASDGPAEDVFNELSRAEASTLRDKHWKSVTVVKPIRVSDMVYTYSFSCENGRTFLRFLRGEKMHGSTTPSRNDSRFSLKSRF